MNATTQATPATMSDAGIHAMEIAVRRYGPTSEELDYLFAAARAQLAQHAALVTAGERAVNVLRMVSNRANAAPTEYVFGLLADEFYAIVGAESALAAALALQPAEREASR